MLPASRSVDRCPSVVRTLAVAVVALQLVACGSPDGVPPHRKLALPSGDTLAYWIEGNGADTVVVLHGGPAAHHAYLRPALSGLERDLTVVYYDMRGRGRSTSPRNPESVSLRTDAEDLRALIDSLGLRHPAILAHHYGAHVATEVLSQDTAAARRLVLLAPMYPRSGYTFALLANDPPGDSKAIGPWQVARASAATQADPVGYCRAYPAFYFFPAFETDSAVTRRLAATMCDAPPPRLLWNHPMVSAIDSSMAIDSNIGQGLEWDHASRISLLTPPVLVVQGSRNRVLGASAREWAGRPREGRLLTIGRTTALFPWLEDPAALREAIRTFLAQGTWPSAALITRKTAPDSGVTPSESK